MIDAIALKSSHCESCEYFRVFCLVYKNYYAISEGYFRLDPEKVRHFPKIPVQPISYEGAYGLLR